MGGVGALPSGGGARQAPEGTEDLQVPAGGGVQAPDTGGVARHSSEGAPPRLGGETTGDRETASTLNFPTRSNFVKYKKCRETLRGRALKSGDLTILIP